MTPDSDFSSLETYLEINPATQSQAWQQSQVLANATSRWTAYLNQLCLDTVLDWLQQDYDLPALAAYTLPSLQSIWEVVTGTAVLVGSTRLVLIPTETIDLDELRIPQEWVDIPIWLADYYLAVQVNPDQGWVKLAGFTNHRQVKTKGHYDWCDRTYRLDDTDLIHDLNVLWVSQQLQPDQITQAKVSDLPVLSLAQAGNLIQRLGNPEVRVPRLAIPFGQWGALLAHGGWRQRLAEQRRELPEQHSVWEWLQTSLSQIAEQRGWQQMQIQPQFSTARGIESAVTTVMVSRQLRIAGQFYALNIMGVEEDRPRVWRFELRPLAPGGQIPEGFKLRLLTEALQSFAGNEDTAASLPVTHLSIDVALAPGEAIVWEIEPTPDQYDPEILCF
jgi:Protein of unknown function (DUF1822)